jgi:predicted transcriptional regulator
MKVLLSIKPEYADKILSGEKCFEYRKAIFRDPSVETVMIYSTMPVGKVVGEFDVATVHSASPREIWKRTEGSSGITWRFFFKYFKGRQTAYAIEVKNVRKFDVPLDLKEVLGRVTPPQSFAYVAV